MAVRAVPLGTAWGREGRGEWGAGTAVTQADPKGY